jgi:O-antigen/teichoic acid export membrane protein
VCLGFNGETLQVFARTRALVWTNIASVVVGIGLLLWLCPIHGPLGAAIAVSIARLTGTGLRHAVLLRLPGFETVPVTQKRIWRRLLLANVAIAAVGWLWPLPLPVLVVVVGAVSLALLRSTAHLLDISRSFPELMRVPLLARLVGA